jgi:hypothetical protein
MEAKFLEGEKDLTELGAPRKGMNIAKRVKIKKD